MTAESLSAVCTLDNLLIKYSSTSPVDSASALSPNSKDLSRPRTWRWIPYKQKLIFASESSCCDSLRRFRLTINGHFILWHLEIPIFLQKHFNPFSDSRELPVVYMESRVELVCICPHEYISSHELINWNHGQSKLSLVSYYLVRTVNCFVFRLFTNAPSTMLANSITDIQWYSLSFHDRDQFYCKKKRDSSSFCGRDLDNTLWPPPHCTTKIETVYYEVSLYTEIPTQKLGLKHASYTTYNSLLWQCFRKAFLFIFFASFL